MYEDVDLPEIARLPIECPRCGRTATSARDQMDPPEAVLAMILCPDCFGGDFGTTTYLNEEGREILPGPDDHAREG